MYQGFDPLPYYDYYVTYLCYSLIINLKTFIRALLFVFEKRSWNVVPRHDQNQFVVGVGRLAGSSVPCNGPLQQIFGGEVCICAFRSE